MAAPSEKSFVTLGQLCTILGNEIIVSDENYNPNGILPGEWGKYTDPVAKTGWLAEHEVLTVVNSSSIVATDNLHFKTAGGTKITDFHISASTQQFIATQTLDNEGGAQYARGLGINSTTYNLYKWIKK